MTNEQAVTCDIRYVLAQARLLPTFLTFLCLFSVAAYALILHSHHETAPLSRFIMWCPGAAAIVTCLLSHLPMARLGLWWPAQRFIWISYFLPLIYATPVYVLTWIMIHGSFAPYPYEAMMAGQYGLAKWPALGTLGVALPLLFTINVVATVTWALGEELGWRGLMFPVLMERVGFHCACLITGIVWAAWHYPGLIWAYYNAGTEVRFAIPCFTVMVIAMSYVSGYLRLRSGSAWPSVLIHATHNTFVQGIFDPLTAGIGRARHITSEFGLGLAMAVVITAWVTVAANRPYTRFLRSSI